MCIHLNGNLTPWFDTIMDVRQGNSLSPSLFNIFISDLSQGMKYFNKGILIGDDLVSLLMYADDVALLAENEEEMQTLLNFTYDWCQKWHMKINMSKTKVTHFRKPDQPCSLKELKIGEHVLEYVSRYKYFGVIFDEFITFDQHIQTMNDSGKRALGAIIAKY